MDQRFCIWANCPANMKATNQPVMNMQEPREYYFLETLLRRAVEKDI